MEFPSVIPSVNPLVIKNIITEGYTDEMKRVILFFYFRRIKNYRWRIHRWSISVGDVVGKLITNGICVLHQRKNSIGKLLNLVVLTVILNKLRFPHLLHYYEQCEIIMEGTVKQIKFWIYFLKVTSLRVP